ncbi:MAG: fibrobacter succinogenes major paralogous domain-containing protein [Prevotella sp.]|jgi:uncharacterized protein (TIGR02145 family)|nr:fibrobacter succinogenes major paralogous domain-containing protein [Prevotella sp.]
MEKIKLNNLIWDDKNIILNEKNLLNWEVAMASPKEDGWRLPTIDEWQAIVDLGSTWDDENPGCWFGPDSELLGDSKESVFLPAEGWCDIYGTLYNAGIEGNYWSASPNGPDAYYLSFDSYDVYPDNTNYRRNGFSVRLVKDVK